MPPVKAPSPTTATRRRFRPVRASARAKPSKAESAVLEWPTPKASKGDSSRLGNPLGPAGVRLAWKTSARSVSTLCPYAWWPTSQIRMSSGQCNKACNATVNSATPKLEARCPALSSVVSRKKLRSVWATVAKASGRIPRSISKEGRLDMGQKYARLVHEWGFLRTKTPPLRGGV